MQYMILMGYKVEGVPPMTAWDPEDVNRHTWSPGRPARERRRRGRLAEPKPSRLCAGGPRDGEVVSFARVRRGRP